MKRNHPTPSLAIIFTLSCLIALTNSYADIHPVADSQPTTTTTTTSLNELLNNTAAGLNNRLPASTAALQIRNAEVKDSELIINNTFIHFNSEQAKRSFTETKTTKTGIEIICNAPDFKTLLNKGATITNSYNGNDDKLAYNISITKKDCTATIEDEESLKVLLEEQVKAAQNYVQNQNKTLSMTRELIIEDNKLIDKHTIKKFNAAELNKMVLAQDGLPFMKDKNNYCSFYSMQKLLNKGAIFVFEYYGNDNKLAFRAVLDKQWCGLNDTEKLAQQQLENKAHEF